MVLLAKFGIEVFEFNLVGGLRRLGGRLRWRRLRRVFGFCCRTLGASSRGGLAGCCCGADSCWLTEVRCSSASSEGTKSESAELSGDGRLRERLAAALSNSSSVKSIGDTSSAMTPSEGSRGEPVRTATGGGKLSFLELMSSLFKFPAFGRKIGDGGRLFGHVFL